MPGRLDVQADGGDRAEDLACGGVLVEAHPDHGGSVELAAGRIADLREARRILLGR